MVGIGGLLLVLAMYSSANRPIERKSRKDSAQEKTNKNPNEISRDADVFPEISGPSNDSPGPLRPPRNGGLLRQRSRRGSLPPSALSDIAE